MKRSVALPSLLVALPLITGLAVAQALVTAYTAREIPVLLVDSGTTTHPDGNTHIRGVTVNYTRQASDPRVNGGTVQWVVNYNLDSSMAGPVWGRGAWENGGGGWEGRFEGSINRVTGNGYYDAVWHGRGDFEGLQLKETCVYTGTPVGDCTGRILDTNKK